MELQCNTHTHKERRGENNRMEWEKRLWKLVKKNKEEKTKKQDRNILAYFPMLFYNPHEIWKAVHCLIGNIVNK